MSAPFDPEAVIDAVGRLLGLAVPPERRPGVAANLSLAAAMAALVAAEPAGDHAEPAPVFRPADDDREDRRG